MEASDNPILMLAKKHFSTKIFRRKKDKEKSGLLRTSNGFRKRMRARISKQEKLDILHELYVDQLEPKEIS